MVPELHKDDKDIKQKLVTRVIYIISNQTIKRGSKRRAPTAKEDPALAWLGEGGAASKRETLARAEVEVTTAPVTTMVPVIVMVESPSSIALLIVLSVGRGVTVERGEPLMRTAPESVVATPTSSVSISQGITRVTILSSMTVGQVVTV